MNQVSLSIDANGHPKPTRRKIDAATVLEMAQLMAKRINETGAALMLGIKPDTWVQWKKRARNKSRFEDLLLRVREAKLSATLDSIDESGDELEVVTPDGSYTKRGDWRAKAWMAERVLAPDRFADRRNDGSAQQPVISISLMTQTLERLYKEAGQKAVVDTSQPIASIEITKELDNGT